MKKIVITLALISLQLFADEGAPEPSMDQQIAWGNSGRKTEMKKEPKVEWAKTFCNNEGTFKIEGEYLYWATNFKLPLKLKWSSGARGTLGYHSKCDNLDIQAIYTYYQNKIHGSIIGNTASFIQNILTGQEHLKLTSNVGDLELGKTFFSETTKVLFRPFIAIRGGWLDQDNSANYTGIDQISLNGGVTTNVPTATSIVLDQDVWCIGPRIGIDMSWLRFGGFSFMVDFSTSLLYGKAHQKLAINNNTASANNQSTGIDYTTINLVGRDKFMVLCPQLQGFIGLQWERCLKNHRSVKLFVGWEANYWWEVSNVLFFNRPLSMQGLTAGLSFNF